MRRELRLILWVTALALVALSVWRGFWPDADISFEDIRSDITTIDTEYISPFEASDHVAELWVGSLPEIDLKQRAMFSVDATPPPEIITGSLSDPPVELPILKGIVERSGRRAAVFAMPAGLASYVVTTIGEQFAGYTLVEIESGQVVTRSAEGDAVIFKLRGTGELP